NNLPRVICDGECAPWDELSNHVEKICGIQTTFQWVGLRQNPTHNEIELVFTTTAEEADESDRAEWLLARTAPLDGLDAEYVQQVKANFMNDAVWSITADSDEDNAETIQLKERK